MMTTDQARAAFPGGWILPDDSDYDEARSTFNGTIDRRPAVVIRPRSTAEVVAAVRWARDEGLPIAVRGGGHNVAGHATADDAAVIDLRHLREVVVDPERRRVRVGGGAIWNDVDAATVPHGLAMTGGTFGDTGVGGLALGGGLGFLMGTNGLTCDHLVGAEVVTADGSVVIAGDGGDPDLLWALRGGGGNFGIVTTFEFALHPLGPLHSGYLTYPIEAGPGRAGRRGRPGRGHAARDGPVRDRPAPAGGRPHARRTADDGRHGGLPGTGRGGRRADRAAARHRPRRGRHRSEDLPGGPGRQRPAAVRPPALLEGPLRPRARRPRDRCDGPGDGDRGPAWCRSC